MHVYPRTHRNYAFGGMFGLNAGFKELTDINLGFLAGLSAVLGSSQKVIVSTGVSYLKVTQLKGEYLEGKPYKDAKLEDMTERVLRPSWFVALSFSISRRDIVKSTP